jgi:hypothetical protein
MFVYDVLKMVCVPIYKRVSSHTEWWNSRLMMLTSVNHKTLYYKCLELSSGLCQGIICILLSQQVFTSNRIFLMILMSVLKALVTLVCRLFEVGAIFFIIHVLCNVILSQLFIFVLLGIWVIVATWLEQSQSRKHRQKRVIPVFLVQVHLQPQRSWMT